MLYTRFVDKLKRSTNISGFQFFLSKLHGAGEFIWFEKLEHENNTKLFGIGWISFFSTTIRTTENGVVLKLLFMSFSRSFISLSGPIEALNLYTMY